MTVTALLVPTFLLAVVPLETEDRSTDTLSPATAPTSVAEVAETATVVVPSYTRLVAVKLPAVSVAGVMSAVVVLLVGST